MRHRDEIVRNLLCVLREGILRIRAHAGNAELCFAEADHLHNLPTLIANPSEDLLRYYLEVELPAYAAKASEVECFEPYWSELRKLVSD